MQESGFVLANRIEKDRFNDKQIYVNGGKTWLKSVFRNLLGNAIKYGDKGGTIGIDIERKASHYQVNVFNSVSSMNTPDPGRKHPSKGGEMPDPTGKPKRRGWG